MKSKKTVKKAVTTKTGRNPKIRKDSNLAEVIFKYPLTAEILLDYGLHCVGCIANSFDTIEMGAKVHGMSDEEINEIVERINEAIKFNE